MNLLKISRFPDYINVSPIFHMPVLLIYISYQYFPFIKNGVFHKIKIEAYHTWKGGSHYFFKLLYPDSSRFYHITPPPLPWDFTFFWFDSIPRNPRFFSPQILAYPLNSMAYYSTPLEISIDALKRGIMDSFWKSMLLH